jgi:hypothetical protein
VRGGPIHRSQSRFGHVQHLLSSVCWGQVTRRSVHEVVHQQLLLVAGAEVRPAANYHRTSKTGTQLTQPTQ